MERWGDRERTENEETETAATATSSCRMATKKGSWGATGVEGVNGKGAVSGGYKRKNAAFILMPLHGLKKMKSNSYDIQQKLFVN